MRRDDLKKTVKVFRWSAKLHLNFLKLDHLHGIGVDDEGGALLGEGEGEGGFTRARWAH